MFRSLITLLAIVCISGCAVLSPPSSSTGLETNHSYWFSYDASRRGAIVLTKDSQVKICSEPSPDVAMSFVNTLKGNFTTPGGSSAQGVDAALNATAAALAGRDDVVLLAREALFRICEAHMNGAIESKDVKPLFQDVFQQVKEIAQAQARTAEGKAAATKTELQILQTAPQLK